MDISERQTGIRTVGGGMGGVAADLAATSMGMRVFLTGPTRWLGGHLSSQGVPPDQHR
ncbi:MAG: FAD-dependent oxidoreductase [Chloroflexi bacterium]|nr:FAD-dependent oxidoreductase [Chloroflexota bacterium]